VGVAPLKQSTLNSEPTAVKVEDDGFKGMAAEFYSDQKQFLEAPADGPYDFGENEAFTVEVVCKLYSYAPTDQTGRQIIMKRSKEGTYVGWSITVLADGALAFVIASEGAPAKVVRSKTPAPLSEWIHIAAVRGENMKMRLLLNGEEVAEGGGTGASLENESNLFVGKHSGAENPGFYFDGMIGAIRISKGDKPVNPDDMLRR
jgi:putative lipoic acid-binding regulatory protein